MKRSSPDIIATVLEAANGGASKTRLLTHANLTSSQFDKYVSFLIEKELLVKFDSGIKQYSYRTTSKGLKYVALYNAIKSVAYLNV